MVPVALLSRSLAGEILTVFRHLGERCTIKQSTQLLPWPEPLDWCTLKLAQTRWKGQCTFVAIFIRPLISWKQQHYIKCAAYVPPHGT